jgi:hypothetical protein
MAYEPHPTLKGAYPKYRWCKAGTEYYVFTGASFSFAGAYIPLTQEELDEYSNILAECEKHTLDYLNRSEVTLSYAMLDLDTHTINVISSNTHNMRQLPKLDKA